jgi:Ca2+/Na+ antiporter
MLYMLLVYNTQKKKRRSLKMIMIKILAALVLLFLFFMAESYELDFKALTANFVLYATLLAIIFML